MEKELFDDAFRLYDAHGLSLSDQHDILAIERPGMRINLYKFAMDAVAAGWSNKKIVTTIKSYCSENNIDIKFVEKSLK